MFGSKHREQQAALAAMAAAEHLDEVRGQQIRALQGQETVDTAGFAVRPGETAVWRLNGAGLVEPRRGDGHWDGRSAGISVPVGAGVRARVGKTRGHFVQGAEAPTLIDQGTALLTSRHVVFAGPKFTRTWEWDKALAVTIDVAHSWISIGVSNRQKTSGISFAGIDPHVVAGWLDVATALHEGRQDELVAELAAGSAST
ncbi:MAG: hypothetical protein M3R71_01045 [Actinomycetota bacterium]|nr:hypothetical protein [Actinomycetota bacterium]